jgi:gluconate 2-dehydrogenase gamma chain
MSQDDAADDRRRNFLKSIGAGGALPFTQGLVGGLGATAISVAHTAEAPPSVPAPPAALIGYTCLSQDEAAFVETMVNVMCPADDLTPNGVDSGLAAFIDRQLAGDFGRGGRRYSRGPWRQGLPQQGLQLPLTPEQHFKAGIAAANDASVARHGKTFDQLAPAEANAFLESLAAGQVASESLALATWFNELVYPLFNQACFADPIYGGNVGKVFWKMIGYPGLPATNSVNVVQFRGKPFPGAKDPKSIADFS